MTLNDSGFSVAAYPAASRPRYLAMLWFAAKAAPTWAAPGLRERGIRPSLPEPVKKKAGLAPGLRTVLIVKGELDQAAFKASSAER
jgi:hypothetical protein